MQIRKVSYWGWMLFSLFFGVMSHVFRGWRWKQTLAPLGAYPKTSDCVDAIFVSYAANLVLPRVGEVSRCGMLAKYDDVSFAKSLGTVVTERLIDTLTILLITGITFLMHGRLPILGYRIGKRLAYITDMLTMPEESYEQLQDLDVLVVNALRVKPHPTHQSISEALETAKRIGARETYFIHMSHHAGLHVELEKQLPPDVHLTFDGMEIEF